jgi:P27 family predicted phage terminase small subunit
MATRGRPPKPTALRLVAQGGKLRARYRNRIDTEPVAAPGLGPPPEHLSDEQRALWARVEATAPPGLLTQLDADLVDGYVVLLASRNHAVRMFNRSGGSVLVRQASQRQALVTNPYLREIRRLTEQLLALQSQLGYSPVSRTRIAIKPKGDANDPLTRFFGATPE